MTPAIPLLALITGLINFTGSDPLISSRPLQAHDLKSGGSPCGEAQLPNQQLGLATMKKYGLTVRRYA